MSSKPASVRSAAIRLGLLSAFSVAACGVTEHPHATQAIDTSNDFGPSTPPPAAPGVSDSASADSANPSEASQEGAGVEEAPAALPLAPIAEPAPTVEPTSTAPTLSGVTIDLGGAEVPKERAIAFIHIGHSNMAGRASRPNSSRAFHFEETHPRAWLYHPG